MIHSFIPIIRKNDYETFRRLMGNNLPDTYDERRYLTLKDKDDAIMRGHVAEEIEIYPDEFVRYVTTHGGEYTLHMLSNCAAEKGMRKK